MNDLNALIAQLEIKYPLDRHELSIMHLGSYMVSISDRPVLVHGQEMKGKRIRSAYAETLERGIRALLTDNPDEAWELTGGRPDPELENNP